MTNGNDSSSSRLGIWLPACQPAEAEAFERSCRETAVSLNGQVVVVFHDDPDRLLAALQAGEIDAVVYPSCKPRIRDSLLVGIVHGVFRGLFGVTLHCASDRTFLAVPHVFVHLVQDVMTNHLRSFYPQASHPVGDNLPLGYRRVGDTVEIDPDQAGQVRDLFSKSVDDD
jgi:hypothetical protein